MYRLDLDDPRLDLPAPVYRLTGFDGKGGYLMREGVEAGQAWEAIEEIAFFAVPTARAQTGLVRIMAHQQNGNTILKAESPTQRPSGGPESLFFALPAFSDYQPPAAVALYEYQRANGQRIYSTNPELSDPDLKRETEPLCRVWKNPSSVLVLDAKTSVMR